MSLGGGGSNAKTKTKPNYTKDQKAILAAGQPAVVDYVKSGGPKLPAGNITPGLNPDQLAAQAAARTAAGGNLSTLSNSATQGTAFLTNPDILSPDSNPYLAKTMAAATAPLWSSLTEEALPNIRGEAVQNGQFGSNRQGIAEGIATGKTAQAAGAVTSGIANQGYQAGLDAMARGLSTSGTAAGVAGQPAALLSQVGQQNYNQQQAQNQEAYNRYMYQQAAPMMAAQTGANYATGLGVGTTTAQVPGKPSPLGATIGGAATGAQLGSNFGPWGTAIGAVGGAGIGYMGA